MQHVPSLQVFVDTKWRHRHRCALGVAVFAVIWHSIFVVRVYISYTIYLYLFLCIVANSIQSNERGSIVVRAHASYAEGLLFEPKSMLRLNARSVLTQQRMGTWWQHWGDKGGEERNWPPYLTCRWLKISVLSNRHSPTYESIRWDYLYHAKSSFTVPWCMFYVRHVQLRVPKEHYRLLILIHLLWYMHSNSHSRTYSSVHPSIRPNTHPLTHSPINSFNYQSFTQKLNHSQSTILSCTQ